MVNKLLYEVDQSDTSLAEFKRDPTAFIADWELTSATPEPPHPRGGVLTDAERSAATNLDFGFLYGHGANPFLLWQFARSVCVPDRMSIEELIRAFRLDVEPHGSPDYFT